jgi:hypothetical protein
MTARRFPPLWSVEDIGAASGATCADLARVSPRLWTSPAALSALCVAKRQPQEKLLKANHKIVCLCCPSQIKD